MSRPTVLLADDHALVVEGLASLLRRTFTLVGPVGDGEQIVKGERRRTPDVMVPVLDRPGMSRLGRLRRLRADGLGARLIFLTMHADAALAAEALRAGASGFVVKHAAGHELVAAIQTVLRGKTYLT